MSEEYIEILDTKSSVLRHIHPTYLKHGKISHKAFKPRPKDVGKLSVFTSAKIALKDGYRTHKFILKRPSDGMTSLAVAVVNACNLKAFNWPLDLEENQVGHAEITKILELNAAHAFIDFRERNEIDTDSLAAVLGKAANESHLYNFEETDIVVPAASSPAEISPEI